MSLQEERQRIMSMNLEQAYKEIAIEYMQMPELYNVYKKVRYGVDIPFDINFIFTKRYTEKIKSKTIRIDKIKTTIHNFWTELEQRESLAKLNLLALIKNEPFVIPREYDDEELTEIEDNGTR